MKPLPKPSAPKQASEGSTRDQEARYQILSELVTDCCWVRWRSADGLEERGWVNDAFTQVTGYTPEEFETIGRSGLVHPDDLEKIQDFIDGPLGVSEHSFRIFRKDGEVRWLHERMRVVKEDDGGLTIYGATRDVTEERRAHQILLKSHGQLEQHVEESTTELRQMNVLLELEVMERTRISMELEKAKEAAEAASEAKSRFLATMTHELRTPLHGIVGLTDLLSTTELSPQAHQWLRTLQRSAQTLNSMVEEVLDFSKIEADKLTLEEEPFSLHQFLDDLLTQFKERAQARGNTLRLERPDGVANWISGDPTRLHQILANLLDNAIKFTQDGTIALIVDPISPVTPEDCAYLRFQVQDTGIGFDDAVKANLFNPFTQADASTTRRYGGTGLGLTISQRLARLMEGELSAFSIPDQGSTFTLTLPVHPCSPKAPTPNPTASIQGAGRRILVAEDNPVNQLVICEQLQLLGFEVQLVDNGRQALDALQQHPFDLWLLDGQMPVMDGLEAVQRWRAQEQANHHLPVIGITATAVPQKLETYFQAGMDEILPKPYQLNDLINILNRWLP